MKHLSLLCVLLSLFLLSGCGPGEDSSSPEVSAREENIVEFSGFTFDADTHTILSYTGSDSVVLIPWSIGEQPVEHIAAFAFENADSVEEITLSVSLQSIEPMAFAGCDNLTAIHVPEGSEAFSESDGVLLSKDGHTIFAYPAARPSENFDELSAYRLPVNVDTIADGAFYGTQLSTVYLRVISTTIGDYAFAESPNLTTVSNATLVTSVGDYAFLNCPQLTSAYLGDALTSMGVGCYQGCSSLLFAGTGQLSHIPDFTFQGCISLDELHFDVPVTSMGKDALSGCDALVGVVCQYGLDQWGISCESPENQALLDSLPVMFVEREEPDDSPTRGYVLQNGEISLYAFESDEPIAKIPEEICGYPVTTLGISATLLTPGQIYIPKTVREIGLGYFFDSSCQGILVDEESAYFTSLDGVLYTKDMSTLVAYPPGKDATTFTLPDTVTEISYHGFIDNEILEEIVLPASLETIGSSAFWGCSALTRISIPEGVTSIGGSAFQDCVSLTQLSLPSTLTGLDPGIILGCFKLDTIWFGGTEAQWNALRENPVREGPDGAEPVTEPLAEQILDECTVYFGQ